MKENFIIVDENDNAMFGGQRYTEEGANNVWNMCDGIWEDESGERRIYIKEVEESEESVSENWRIAIEDLRQIRTRKDAIAFHTCFSEFGIGSFKSEVRHIWFRDDGYKGKHPGMAVTDDDIGFTIDHEYEGYVPASMRELIDYIYRNRKYINAWIKDVCFGSDNAEHFTIESEMKAAEI